jgi:hypothetical protein
MQANRERWMELAELAANEQDPNKLMALVAETNELLEQKRKRLENARPPNPATTTLVD